MGFTPGLGIRIWVFLKGALSNGACNSLHRGRIFGVCSYKPLAHQFIEKKQKK